MTTTDDYSWLREVSDRQVLAIDTLVAGGTHQEAAAAAGVHRVTVSNWARRHPGFMAEVNRRRGELRAQRDFANWMKLLSNWMRRRQSREATCPECNSCTRMGRGCSRRLS